MDPIPEGYGPLPVPLRYGTLPATTAVLPLFTRCVRPT